MACDRPYQGINPGTETATTQGCPEGYGRRGVTVSSGLSLAFMVIGLLAVVFALVVVWRRAPGTTKAQLTADRSQLDSATSDAEHIRARAQTEASGSLERARSAADQAAQG